ncbi:hypothetical protein MID13_22915 [Vibrio gigantis]|uniref:hypothetical protein n=1 Tax=Vibrio gigantis TaxID=296199 RepID=UPI001EFB2BDF|nr:hypothetical protein [Vibrio gigantis]ULN66415.1 hypothetical protein MID13_22915 [Vibrio gigantis]
MKLKLLSTLIAASFLAGCSSSGSSDNPPAAQDGIADVQHIQGEHFNIALVEGDEGNHQARLIQGVNGNTLIVIDDMIFVTDGDEVKNANGDTVGHIQKEGDTIVFHGNHGGEVVLTVENGRLIASEIKTPIDPDFGIPMLPEHPIEIDPDYGVTPKDVWFVSEDGTIKFNGEEVAEARPVDVNADGSGLYQIRVNDQLIMVDVINYGGYVQITSIDGSKSVDITITDGVIERINWDSPSIGHPIQPEIDHPVEADPENPIYTDPDFENGKIIKNIEREEIADGILITVEGFHGGEVSIITDKDGKVLLIEANQDLKDNVKGALGIIDPGFGLDKDPRELRKKVQNLSQEQRQQIKQAVKDRASRS